MQITPDERLRESPIKSVCVFLVHQLNATLGIMILASVLTSFTLALVYLSGLTLPSRAYTYVLTGTPFYPVQILVALVFGFLLSHLLAHRPMLWVWVFPLTLLCGALIIQPTLTSYFPGGPKQDQTRWSHYFGWGCLPDNPCVTQLLTTLPFYTATFYSIGALLARRLFKYTRGRKKEFWTVLMIGLALLAATFEPVFALMFTAATEFDILKGYLEWVSAYWWIIPTVGVAFVVFPAALGTYLVRSALHIRQTLSS